MKPSILKKIALNPYPYFVRFGHCLQGVWYDLLVRTYRADGCRYVFPSDQMRIHERGQAYFNGFEAPERAMVMKHLPADSTVLELGGCLGVVSCVINRRLLSPQKHVVVEPNIKLIAHLETNRSLNHCRFAIENCVVSDSPIVPFYTNTSIVLGSLRGQGAAPENCAGLSISQIEERHNLKFDFFVMDIEGGEIDLILNNSDFLRPNLRGIIIERHPESSPAALMAECKAVLDEYGLVLVDTIGHVECYLQRSFSP